MLHGARPIHRPSAASSSILEQFVIGSNPLDPDLLSLRSLVDHLVLVFAEEAHHLASTFTDLHRLIDAGHTYRSLYL